MKKEKGKTMRQTTQSNVCGGWLELSPMDWHQRPALLVGAPKCDQAPTRLPGQTLGVRECPGWAACAGRLGC
jgi:hypothetical protein